MALSAIRILCFVGLFLAGYALYVEHKVSVDPDYVASCDLASWISCSKVFSSEYAHVFFGIPNAALGVLFYLFILVLDSMKMYQYIMYLATLSLLISVYLAYILAFVLKDMCVVCVSTYVVNTIMFLSARYYAKVPKKSKNP